MDRVSADVRSRNMARIKSVDTLPERKVRSFLHSQGLRYRLHARNLPGQPDLVFTSRRACVFVHGCFWHGCRKCMDGTHRVKSNQRYWISKIARNKNRDSVALKTLQRNGWKVCVIWECEVENPKRLDKLLDQIQKRRSGRPGSDTTILTSFPVPQAAMNLKFRRSGASDSGLFSA